MAANEDSELGDFLPTSEELEEALCVLAGSDPDNCSYSRGYMKRQAVFACNTCTPNAAEPAGICLACANKCHDGHNIFELYTKRNFRCDCGNTKFGDFQCQLIAAKDEENVRNHYNHNYSGLYCTCDRPYPDTDEQVSDEMIQCVICEDWFHIRHLGCTIVESEEEEEEEEEMVCEACMNRTPFLWTYAAHFAAPPVVSIDHTEKVEVKECGEREEACEPGQRENEGPSTSVEDTKPKEMADMNSPSKRTHDQMTDSPEKAQSKAEPCRLQELQAQGLDGPRQGAVFWPYSWRSELCTCTSCKRAYVSAGVQFLIDQSDTVLAYEKRGLDEPFGQHPLMALTSSMDHVQKLEFIYGFNELTSSISEFFAQCAAEGKTVTVEAVHEFFEELRASKRRRTDAWDE